MVLYQSELSFITWDTTQGQLSSKTLVKRSQLETFYIEMATKYRLENIIWKAQAGAILMSSIMRTFVPKDLWAFTSSDQFS